jgi:hypothetical protein
MCTLCAIDNDYIRKFGISVLSLERTLHGYGCNRRPGELKYGYNPTEGDQHQDGPFE